MLRPVLVSLVMALSATGCTCAQLPERLWACADQQDCLPGEVCRGNVCIAATGDDGGPSADGGNSDAGTSDAGAGDAGTSDAGTSDAGTSDAGASDAGSDDAGIISDCDGGLCRFDDGGWCETWACVTELWPEPATSPGSMQVDVLPLPAGVDGGAYGWFGGVLLPTGEVLAIAHTADRFLLVQNKGTVVPFGPPLGGGAQRKYLGGVLAPNGRVYVMPYEAPRILEVTWEDGGMREVGPLLASADGGAPLYTGGVVDAEGTIWGVSERPDAIMSVIRFWPLTEQVDKFAHALPSGWGGWFGLTRLPNDDLLAFPKETFSSPALSSAVLRIRPRQTHPSMRFTEVSGFDARDAGFTFQGAALTHAGHACAIAAGPDARYLCITGSGPALHVGPVSRYGLPATFGDGRVWTSPDDDALTALDADGGFSLYPVATPGGSTRYAYLGMVATPNGFVVIPGTLQSGGFLLLRPGRDGGVGETRPMPVLLSPFFNKL